MITKKICAALVTTMLISSAAMAATDKKDSEPSEVTAEVIEYDMNTKKVTAAGNVFIKHGTPTTDNQGTPSQLNADAVEYDMANGVMTAAGNVLLKHGLMKATGLHALYNVNTKEAHLVGNVIVIREDMRITCNTLASNGKGYMTADGNVIATQTLAPNAKYPNGDTRTFRSERIDYFPDDRKHFLIPTGGVAESVADGTFTADYMEGWIDDEHYIGTGNAHLVSPARNMEAGGDMVDYSGKDAGKAVLSGNAWAHQDNNTIRGNHLTVYLADDGKLKAKDDNAVPKLEVPKLEMPQMPTVDKAFEKSAQVDDKKTVLDEFAKVAPAEELIGGEAVDKPFAEPKAEPAQIEPETEDKSAEDTITIDPASESDEATNNEP